MHCIIDRGLLIRMIERTRRGTRFAPNRDPDIRIAACAARVFVIGPTATMGHEALVLRDGECWLPTKKLLQVLRSFAGKEDLTLEARDGRLHIARFSMPLIDFNPDPEPPADFQVLPVTDLRLLVRQ